MNDSVTYQAILEGRYAKAYVIGFARGYARGFTIGCRRILLRVGRKRLGQPSPEVLGAIEATVDVRKLERMACRLFDVSTWEEVLEST